MLSYGSVNLQIPSAEEAVWIESRIPIREAFAFFRPRWLADPAIDHRSLFNWFLSRPVKLNCLYIPWGASRFGYALVLADAKMHAAITAQNLLGQSLAFKVDDNVGGFITTPLFMLPPVPLSKINVIPSLPLYLIPLVDLRYYFWERAVEIDVVEGATNWTELYEAVAAGLGITLIVDPISGDYLLPSNGFTKHYQHLPLLLDYVAASVGQRIVRTLDGSFYARNASTANALMIANCHLYEKYAGGSYSFGVVEA